MGTHLAGRVQRFASDAPRDDGRTPETIVRRSGQYRRTIDSGERTTGEIIGGITLGVFDRAAGEAAFSYLLNRAAWGQGYATEALTEMVRFGFAVLGLQRIADGCDVENTASARVMEKCGFQFEGEHDGERRYGLSATAWQTTQSQQF